MLDIHGSKEEYEKIYEYPKGSHITNVPYNGEPFSAHTIITGLEKEMKIRFGTGGYYPDTAHKMILDFFKQAPHLINNTVVRD